MIYQFMGGNWEGGEGGIIFKIKIMRILNSKIFSFEDRTLSNSLEKRCKKDFATNSNFLIPISFHPDGVNL